MPAGKRFISLYLDEDISVKIAANLKNRGFDVLHAVDAKMLSVSDEEQLNKAVIERKTFLTHNKKHFCILHDLQKTLFTFAVVVNTICYFSN